MSLDGTLEFPEEERRYPGRHAVVEAVLVRGAERIPVVVKKTRTTLKQRLTTLKAVRSYETAKELLRRGLPTPEPLGVALHLDESWYVARRLAGAEEVRRWFMHRDDARNSPAGLAISLLEVVRALGTLARKMHDAGVFFRDFTDGNVLVTGATGACKLWLVDLNRARLRSSPIPRLSRLRDLARPGLNTAEDRNVLLESYFHPEPAPRWAVLGVSALRARIVFWDALKQRLKPFRT